MSLDLLDAAFVQRLTVPTRHGRGSPAGADATPRPAPSTCRAAPVDRPPVARPVVRTVATPPAVIGTGSRPEPPPPLPLPIVEKRSVPEPAAEDPVVARLLARAPGEWDALAGHVEAARQRGRRVIAVAGGRAGEGRTTLVRCLAATLRSRGRDVACTAREDLGVVTFGPDGRGPTHDKRIIVVDAGIWFPPGPIRRSLLQVASLGCDAAILVRRAGTSGGSARTAALEALGIEVLGEVVTFESASGADDTAGGGATA